MEEISPWGGPLLFLHSSLSLLLNEKVALMLLKHFGIKVSYKDIMGS